MKLTDLFEASRGSQVVNFAHYVEVLGEVAPGLKEDYKKIGSALFKQGFTYDDTLFYWLPQDQDGVWEIKFPAWSDVEAIKNGRLHLHHYHSQDGKIARFRKHMTINEIKLWTVPTLIKHMKEAARVGVPA